ncbi:MAG: DUF1257 domain-containing protein [Victivallales bacterium]|jgi:hypothetical protein|nr:DUF1257 domain-containing protein [Victivallales bacterium]
MSHFTQIHTKITDIEALRSACAELGLEVAENAQARGFGRNTRSGRHVIRLAGPYDVAVNPTDSGDYSLETDLWQGHVEKELGPGLGRLRQLYGVHKATAEAKRRGLRVRRRALADGRIRLAVSGV